MHDNWNRLKGSKRLVVGNHDDIKFLSGGDFFKKVLMWRYFSEFNLLLTHVPVHPSSLKEGMVNVHGHTHTRSVEGPYKCVCVEQINYTPINIEEVRSAT
jgi:calcineurin-like phosphoesterase family protein